MVVVDSIIIPLSRLPIQHIISIAMPRRHRVMEVRRIGMATVGVAVVVMQR